MGESWLREAQTEGETSKLTATKSQALSPTRFAGAPSQRGPLLWLYNKQKACSQIDCMPFLIDFV